MGKRKILIEEIKDDRHKRSVTFTKRRDGLFKKAETACQKFSGLQICILAFSPGGKPFTFTNSSSSVSLDEIIDTYMSSSSCSTSSAVVVGKRNRLDEDDVQLIETEKKKRKTMNAVVPPPPPPCITIEEEEEDEKFDQGFHWDHYQNLDSDQTHHDDQEEELRNEFFTTMGYGENNARIIVTEEMINMVESSELLVEGESRHNWGPPDVQEIVNVEDDDDDDDDFEYYGDHHCDDDETRTMGLHPPSHTPTTTTTSTSFCDLLSASNMNNDDEEAYYGGYTLEEWEHILSTSSPTTTVVVDTSSYLNPEEEQVPADNWPTQEFVQHLCS